jgi:hypothetical protein
MKTKNIDNPRPTIIFGDIHGLTYWKKAVDENPDCRYIFLGDYLDPYEDIPRYQLMGNMKKIIRLKKSRPDDVILLLGNHDLHYMDLEIEPCCRFDDEIEEAAHALFSENKSLFSYAFQEDNRIFTHAGISKRWFFEDFWGDTNQNIAEQLNNPAPDKLPALYRCGFWRGGDVNAVGGIFWADSNELHDPLPGYIQFVGHNRVDGIRKREKNGGMIVFCDCLYKNKYLKLKF